MILPLLLLKEQINEAPRARARAQDSLAHCIPKFEVVDKKFWFWVGQTDLVKSDVQRCP